MLAFAPTPRPPRPPAPGGAFGRRVVLVSATAAALATTQPWIAVQFERLFGAHPGPPGWQSNGGFTCLCTCLLVAMLALAETRAKSTQEASRPACAFLTALCAVALAVKWSTGPGQLRGVSARWTAAFWLAAASVPALLVACLARCPRRPTHGAPEAT